jgi:hypothetical protein
MQEHFKATPNQITSFFAGLDQFFGIAATSENALVAQFVE